MEINDPERRSPKTNKCGVKVSKIEYYSFVLTVEWTSSNLTIYFLILVAFQNKKIN